MALTEYRHKRNFRRTSEPRGHASKAAHRSLSFVIQKHAASHLHYDFRLEWGGVLKSWAVPKGPSLDPSVRALAIEVEDHPLEYGGFEGTIPKGEYGGGTVLLWDRGEWIPANDPKDGFQRGKLEFELRGEKLHGRWKLVRMRPENGGRVHWLLMKSTDEHAQPRSEYDVLSEEPLSVTSGRDLDQIAAKAKPVKGRKSKKAGRVRPAAVKRAKRGGTTPKPSELPGAKRESKVRWRPPQLATLVEAAPEGDDWIHEAKYDGYRLLALLQKGHARLISRNEKDWTDRFASVAAAVEALPVAQAVFDGEVVVLNSKGLSDFQALQNAMQAGGKAKLYYFAFDLLHLDGFDLTAVPLIDRKVLLAALIPKRSSSIIRLSEHVRGNGSEVFEQACKGGLEGIISKRAGSVYESRRSRSWLKVKCVKGQEFVIGGFTDPAGARVGFGALLLGYYTAKDSLRYCGRVGTGFSGKTLHSILAQLKKLEQREPAFVNPPTGMDARGVHWVKPQLVGEVRYTEITSDGILRHPSFSGLRMDKKAQEVVREVPLLRVREDGVIAQRAPAKKSRRSRLMRNMNRTDVSDKAPDRRKVSEGKNMDRLVVAGVGISHPDRVLYSKLSFTKADLGAYYEKVADQMLPHVSDRPLMLVRCPEGAGGPCFHQKHPSAGPLSGLRGVPIREKGKTETYMVVDDVRGLVTLVQMGALEVHTWGSTTKQLEKPDRLIFDLDPGPGVKWASIVEAALLVRDQLAEIGLTSFVKTTGGKGLHVLVPLRPAAEWEAAKSFAQAVSQSLVALAPDRFVGKMTRSLRAGKIYIDYLRNGRGSTCVAAFSSRAREGAGVSFPLSWRELKNVDDPAEFNVKTVPSRLARRSDPWPGFWKSKQSLSPAFLKKLAGPSSTRRR
ncbi:MAG TPA: DNA ligase D [Phycisphaerae bacterium]|nr:DNA ligase D [Phycisphaerae bacterium]